MRCVLRRTRPISPRHHHHFVRIWRLTIGREPKFHNLWLYPMGFERQIATEGYNSPAYPALTGGCGGGQCPAPLPDRYPPMTLAMTLQIAPATPDKPLLTPQLGSVS